MIRFSLCNRDTTWTISCAVAFLLDGVNSVSGVSLGIMIPFGVPSYHSAMVLTLTAQSPARRSMFASYVASYLLLWVFKNSPVEVIIPRLGFSVQEPTGVMPSLYNCTKGRGCG